MSEYFQCRTEQVYVDVAGMSCWQDNDLDRLDRLTACGERMELVLSADRCAKVLGFKLSNSGLVAALPLLASIGGVVVFGFVGDYVRNRKYMSVICIRKSNCVFCKCVRCVLNASY